MVLGGCDDIYEVAGIHEEGWVQETGELIFFGDFGGDGIVWIIESDQFGYFDLFPVIQVQFSQVTNSEHTYFKHLLIFILPQTYIKMMKPPMAVQRDQLKKLYDLR